MRESLRMRLLDDFVAAIVTLLLLCGVARAAQPFVTPEKESRLRQLTPVSSYAQDPDVWFYTEKEMPRAFQFAGPGQVRTGFIWGYYNLSGDAAEAAKEHGRGGHPNNYVEFPWAKPGGTDHCANTDSFKFLKLPAGKPVVYFRKRVAGNFDNNLPYTDVLSWVYPVGTKFGEVLIQRGPDGYDYPFEMRVRERLAGKWTVEIFRPFPTAESLVRAVSSAPGTDALVNHLTQRATLPVKTLTDAEHRTNRAFSETSAVDEIPALPEDLVSKLLMREFQPADGELWRDNCFAPTTKARWHIVPAGYTGGFLGNDQTSCRRCHDSALQHADHFDEPRQWYGFTRGADEILSWHPLEPGCIAQHGEMITPRIRPASFVEPYNPAVHDAATYHELLK